MCRLTCPLALLAVLTLTVTTAHAESWELDSAHAAVMFKVSHFDGLSHQYGRFNDIKGSLNTGEDSAFEFTVATASIDTNNAKRDDHLRSPDFFNAKQFPVITFRGSEISETDNGLALSGDLTLHGVTQPLSVVLTKVGEGDDPWGNHRIGLETTFTIKRSEFGMDKMIGPVGDEVTLIISFEAIRQ